MTREQRIRWYGSAAGLMLVGVVCGFVVPGIVGDIIRLTLLTLGAGWVIGLVFYEVGLSEDKARAKEEEERRGQQPEHDDAEERPWSARRPRRPN